VTNVPVVHETRERRASIDNINCRAAAEVGVQSGAERSAGVACKSRVHYTWRPWNPFPHVAARALEKRLPAGLADTDDTGRSTSIT